MSKSNGTGGRVCIEEPSSVAGAAAFVSRDGAAFVSRDGRETSEYKETRDGAYWGVLATGLGLILAGGATWFPESGEVGGYAGAIIAVAGLVQTLLIRLGYIKSRSAIKVAAINAEAAVAVVYDADDEDEGVPIMHLEDCGESSDTR